LDHGRLQTMQYVEEEVINAQPLVQEASLQERVHH
jgi:hypothetical protein